MIVSYPSTMLHTHQREVKDAAQAGPVLITCADNRNLVLCSRELFSAGARERQAQQDYEQKVIKALLEAQNGIARGDYVRGVEEAIAESERMRLAYA